VHIWDGVVMAAGSLPPSAALREKGILMNKKETILLDARLLSVIDNNAFDAELRNGHRFVAFSRRGDVHRTRPEIGEEVRVEMAPYDMSKGRLVTNQD
jgi:translation initiation factor IF-1